MIDDRVLYTVTIETQDGVLRMLALGVSIEQVAPGQLAVHWHDTVRGHATLGELVRETDTGFVWRRRGEVPGSRHDGDVLTFEVVTLERFEREVRRSYLDVPDSVPSFRYGDEELWEWYRRQFFGVGRVYKGRQKPDGTPIEPPPVL